MNTAGVFFGFIAWWYSGGVKKLFDYLEALFFYLTNLFSVKEIAKTFFTPWKRIIGARRPGLAGLGDWIIDNLISRFVGVTARLILLVIYFLAMILYLIFAGFAMIFWFGLPLFIIFSLINLFI